MHRHIKKGRCRGHPPLGEQKFQVRVEEAGSERFSHIQAVEIEGDVSTDFHAGSSNVMLGQFSEEKHGAGLLENFHTTKSEEGGVNDCGGEILGVFQDKQTGEVLAQRLPSLVLPLPPLSSIS